MGAWVHGSELRTDPPSPERKSLHSAAVGHSETGHRVEDLARQLYLDSLSVEGSTSHTSTDDRLVPVDRQFLNRTITNAYTLALANAP